MAGRVLIADNQPTSRIALKVALSTAAYHVIQATNRDELLAQARNERPDVVIMDSAFDDDRAIDLCMELNGNATTAQIPVLIIASDYSPGDRLAAFNAGVGEILSKPVSKQWLLACVRNILRTNSIEQELHLRRKTAVELGFQEAETPFERQGQIVVIGPSEGPGGNWHDVARHMGSSVIHHVKPDCALDEISARGISPDLIVLPAACNAMPAGGHLLAEFRSRPATRHAAIVIIESRREHDSAIAALDMGADDIIAVDTPAAEISFRLKRQLRRKLGADRLRNTLEAGLRLAVTDPLTGLFNRRYALPYLERVARESALSGRPFAVMILDLDRFKTINDKYGHRVGDRVLKEIADRLRNNIRSVDLVARVGGEEFLVVLPDTDLAAARVAAERLRRVTGDRPVDIGPRRDPVFVTTSIGVSLGGCERGEVSPVEDMVERADQAMLSAKTTGRNQILFEKSAA